MINILVSVDDSVDVVVVGVGLVGLVVVVWVVCVGCDVFVIDIVIFFCDKFCGDGLILCVVVELY